MPSFSYSIVDAFTQTTLKGNGAAVVVLDPDSQLQDGLLQAIAAEFNLSETAYATPIDKDRGQFSLRWFTPTSEVALCGHATLAIAHILFSNRKVLGLADHVARLEFSTRKSGVLVAQKLEDGRIELEFPAGQVTPLDPIKTEHISTVVSKAFHSISPKINFLGDGRDIYDGYLLIEIDENYNLQGHPVNTDVLRELAPAHRVIIVCQRTTAPSDKDDFNSRVFGPAVGVPEDPVTGSAHSFMAAYWQNKLGKDPGTELSGRQVSLRSGEVGMVVNGSVCKLRGYAALAARGEFFYDVPESLLVSSPYGV